MKENPNGFYQLDHLDRKIILATQNGLPLVPRPYEEIALRLGINSDLVKTKMTSMLEAGVIRRIAAVPNHYRVGFSANGMTVWNVPDENVDNLGEMVGALEYVTHCYSRPRYLPDWPYNLFAMVHGKTRAEVYQKAESIKLLLEPYVKESDILFSQKVLKKTGFRLVETSEKGNA